MTCTVTYFWQGAKRTHTLTAETRDGLDRQKEWLRELGFRIVDARYEGTKQPRLIA